MLFVVLGESAAHFVVFVFNCLGMGRKLRVFGFEHLNSGLEHLGFGRELRVSGLERLNMGPRSLGFGHELRLFGLERLDLGLKCLDFGCELRLFDLKRFVALLVMFDARDASCDFISAFCIPHGASIANRSSPVAPALPSLTWQAGYYDRGPPSLDSPFAVHHDRSVVTFHVERYLAACAL